MTSEHVRHAVHPALRGLVASCHGYHYAGGPCGLHRGLPSSDLTVVIAFDEPLDVAWLGVDDSRGEHWAMASGLHTAPAAIRHRGFQHGIQLGFTPAGARRLLGLPAGPLSGELVSLEELWGPTFPEMYDEVARAPSWTNRFDALDGHLLRRLGAREPEPVRPELGRAWRSIHASRGTTEVGALAREVGWSRRHLTAAFTEEFGLGPKALARVVRMQHARSLITVGTPLATAALDAGYSDQAHLTREWSALVGCPPTTWIREELPFVQDLDTDPLAASTA